MGIIFSVVFKGFWAENPENTSASTTANARQEEYIVSNGDSESGVFADPNGEVTEDDEGMAALVEEALPNIRLLINHELPDGSGNEHNITFNPHNTVSQLRTTMETFSGVPQDNIYFIFNTQPLIDSLTLSEQRVGGWDRITLRDNRSTYAYPF